MKAERQIISRIPLKGMDAHQWGVVIEHELIEIWVRAMSSAERAVFGEGNLQNVSPASYAKLDAIILRQAQTLGWRITLSALVRYRMSEWDMAPDGPQNFEKLGGACAKSARILQRKELPPVTDADQWLVKKETTDELRLVLERVRSSFAPQREESSHVHQAFSAIVSASPESFPHLAPNLERWAGFFAANPDTLRSTVIGGRAKPAALYDEFLAWSSGWDQESLRQKIAELGNSKL